MLALPISMVVSLSLAYLLARLVLKRRITRPLAWLLVACILQGIVNALAQFYGVSGFRFVQPVTAVAIPPLAWLALRHAQGQGHGHGGAERFLHLLSPAFVAFCVWTARDAIDVAVVAIFAGYGTAMLAVLRDGADALPEARLGAGDWPPLVWRAIAVTLLVSALSDTAIALAVLVGSAWLKSWIVSFGTSATLLLIGILASSRSIGEGAPEADVADAAHREVAAHEANETESAAERERDIAIMGDVAALLDGHKLYRDSELTLSRIARRLGLPAKRVSEAINRQTGENVSRYVNGFRISAACVMLEAGRSVTEAMLDSGFATKSNFNREFRRVTGQAPTEWATTTAALPRNEVGALARPARLTASPDAG